MKIEAGHAMFGEITPISQDIIRFLADDGRCMFEVTAGKDGKSLEVRGVDVCKVDGKLYGSAILVVPNVSNSVTILSRVYQDFIPGAKL